MNEVQWCITIFMFIPLTIFLHELGHYIPAKIFGFKPKFQWGISVSRVVYELESTPTLKLCIVSFCGILGVLAVIPLFMLTQDIPLTYMFILYNFCYSAYEAIMRYRDLRNSGSGDEQK